MKVSNWRRKLVVSLIAGGILAPSAAQAAPLLTNLVTDGSFENVDTNDQGPFTSDRLLDWEDTNLDGDPTDDNFAYRFEQNYAGTNTPTGAGLRYFTGGFNTTVGQANISQSVDVSTTETGALIPTGEAAYSLSGFFSSYATQADSSGVRIRFLGGGGSELGTAEIGGFDFVQGLPTDPNGTFGEQRDWGQDSLGGPVPIGTQMVAVEVFSDIAATNHDGYVDLVDLQIGNIDNFVMVLTVDTNRGSATLSNLTGNPIEINYYEILSESGSLSETGWDSLEDQDLAGFPAGNGTGNGWEEAGGSGPNALSESYLTASSLVVDQASIGLGNLFNPGGTTRGIEDLVFRYGLASGQLIDGFVRYEVSPFDQADFDQDGDVDGDDFLLWQGGFGTPSGAVKMDGDYDNDGDVDGDDFLGWQAEFGNSSGNGSAAVPEPSTLGLFTLILAGLGVSTIRRSKKEEVV